MEHSSRLHRTETHRSWCVKTTGQATALAVALGLVAACEGGRPGLELNALQFGSQWPFTVATVTLHCIADVGGRKYVVVDANGATYALNGSARGAERTQRGDWLDAQRISKPEVPTQVIITRGLTLCAE